jgi:hypothetical protein
MSADATSESVPASPPISVNERGLQSLKLFETERACYRRELSRLVADGHIGRFALIKGDVIFGVLDTWADANQAGLDRFGLDQPFCIQKIDPQDEKKFALLDAWMIAQCRP